MPTQSQAIFCFPHFHQSYGHNCNQTDCAKKDKERRLFATQFALPLNHGGIDEKKTTNQKQMGQ